MTEWKNVQNETPQKIEGQDYSEEVVFVTKNGETHTGFYSHTFWFDIDEVWQYSTEEVDMWIYEKDFLDCSC